MNDTTTPPAGAAWLTIEQVSARLQIPVRTLYDWRQNGTGPPGVKFGRSRGSSVRYRLTAVEDWEREREQAAAARTA